MPRFAYRFLSLVVILTTPLLIASLSFRASNLDSETFKKSLVSTGIYESTVAQMTEMIDESIKEMSRKDPLHKTLNELRAIVTPAYLEGKLNKAIDETTTWFENPTSPTPSLSFADLKESLLSKNPEVVKQLLRLQAEYEKNLPEIQATLNEQAQTTPNAEVPTLPTFDLQKFIDNDLTIPLAPYVSWMKPLYFLVVYGLPFSLFAIGVSLALIFFTLPKPDNYRRISRTLILSALLSGLPLLAYIPFLRSYFPTPPIPTFTIPPAFASAAQSLSTALLDSYRMVAIIVVGTYLLIALTLSFVAKKTVVQRIS